MASISPAELPAPGADSVVYVVDDDEAVRDSLGLLLEAHGIGCQTFESAAAFLGAYRPGTGACLVLDIRMPGMNGVEMLEKLRGKGLGLPVVMMSGHADDALAARAIAAGARSVVSKPFRDRELLAAINDAIASRAF
jgi:two-component system response regulator FixJ